MNKNEICFHCGKEFPVKLITYYGSYQIPLCLECLRKQEERLEWLKKSYGRPLKWLRNKGETELEKMESDFAFELSQWEKEYLC